MCLSREEKRRDRDIKGCLKEVYTYMLLMNELGGNEMDSEKKHRFHVVKLLMGLISGYVSVDDLESLQILKEEVDSLFYQANIQLIKETKPDADD